MSEVKIEMREHKVVKETRWGDVEKSLNQDFVFVNGQLAGYYLHGPKAFAPLAGWDNAMSPAVEEGIKKIKGEGSVRSLVAPPIELSQPQTSAGDEDE